MRVVVAKRTGRRGAGLGNEMLAWGKGWIASRVLDARLVGPSWGLNERRYDRNFRTPRWDFALEETLKRFARYTFTEADYDATGEADFGDALEKWAQKCGLGQSGSYVVAVEGMWGGYRAIHKARNFLLAQLLNSRDALKNVYSAVRRDQNKLFVTVHMRAERDGFADTRADEEVRGRFNIFVPGEWYLSVCEALQRQFGERVQFHFLTDKRDAVFEEAVRRFNPGQTVQSGFTECSDLLLMTEADLRVCSVSSYSLAACFLSGGPYLWYEPQLTLRDGVYSLWGNEARQQEAGSPTAEALEYAKTMTGLDGVPGIGMRLGEAAPDVMVRTLEQRLRMKEPRTNLVDYGAIPRAMLSETKQAKWQP